MTKKDSWMDKDAEKLSFYIAQINTIKEKADKGEVLSKKELEYVYGINLAPEESFAGHNHTVAERCQQIKKGRNAKEDLAIIFEIKPSQVSTTREEALQHQGEILLHDGNLDLNDIIGAESLILPERIRGSLWLSRVHFATGIVFPQRVDQEICLDSLISTDGLILPENFSGTLRINHRILEDEDTLKERYPTANIIIIMPDDDEDEWLREE